MAAPVGRLPERRYRLTGVGAFETVFREGRRREGGRLQIVFTPARRFPGCAGFVLGRKVLPRAVDRNRVRRILRECLRRNRERLVPYDVIVRLKRAGPRPTFPELADEAEHLIAALPGPIR